MSFDEIFDLEAGVHYYYYYFNISYGKVQKLKYCTFARRFRLSALSVKLA